ncbi:MAG TPA: hypothetical protein VFZ66_21515 [Herpetosiphonaceae bacterium]
MIRNMLCAAILIVALLATTGCGSDPASASGNIQDEGTPPNSTRTADSSAADAPQAALPPAQNQGAQAVPGQPAQGSGGMGATGGGPQAQPGVPAAAPPGQQGAPNAAPAQPASWLTYSSAQFNFSIDYPDVYVVAEGGDLPQNIPHLIQRVRFMDKALAASPTANLQPPQFMIDVFENTDALVLEDWIAANERRGTPTEADVGNLRGYLVALQTMQAPNQFYFVSHGQYVYRLTPLGHFSAEMLRSFKIS